MKYRVFFTLSDESEIKCDCMADDQQEAVEKAVTNDNICDYLDRTGLSISDVYAKPLRMRYTYNVTKRTDGVFVKVTDNDSGCVVEFEQGKYNSTAKVITAPDTTDPNESATILRKITDYVAAYHRMDAFESESVPDYVCRMVSNAINAKRLRLQDVAERSGVEYLSVKNSVTNGKISAIRLVQIAEALGGQLKIVFPEDE